MYPPIKPSCTEHYYTKSVWHVEECRHTQVRCTSSHILAPNVCKCYKDYFHSTPIHSYPSTCSLLYDYTKVLHFKELLSFPIEIAILWVRLTFSKTFLTGKKCLKRLANLHRYVLGMPNTVHYVRTLCDKYFFSYYGFSWFWQEGLGIGFWNMV